jgi:hypothetical protein
VDKCLQPNSPATRAKRIEPLKVIAKNFLSLFFVFNHAKCPLLRNEMALTKPALSLHHQPTPSFIRSTDKVQRHG